MACLFKRGEKFWVSYYLSNQQIKKSLGTSDERVAKSKLKKLEYELAIGDLQGASKIPLISILEAFCKELQATRTFKSYKNDFSRLRVFFGPVCGLLKPGKAGGGTLREEDYEKNDKYAGRHVTAKHLEDITSQSINRFLSARIQEDNWLPKTVNLMRETLHKLFSYAITHYDFRSRDRRYPNPVTAVGRQSEPAPEIRFLNIKEIGEQLTAIFEHHLFHAMVATYIYAGLRREEALWLLKEDVDLKNRLIRVRAKTIDGKFWQPKTKRNRTIPISEALHKILSAYTPPADCFWFFPTPNLKRWNPDNFSRELRKLNRIHRMHWNCLDYRHTFGSQLAQKGESLFKIATLMGNSPEICRKHYAALIPEEMMDVVEFSKPKNNADNFEHPGETQELLQEILREVRQQRKTRVSLPRIRLVPGNEPA